MKVTLEKSFPLPAAADVAWALLQDIPAVASCMPGATITERIDASHYKGTVAVKFGPANMAFRGEIEVIAVDAAAKAIRLGGRGTDSTGSSGASMELSARVEAVDGSSSNLIGKSDVSMSGKAAAFGGRMMGSVSDQILKQFGTNFANKAQALRAQATAQAASPPGGAGQAAGREDASAQTSAVPSASAAPSPGTAPSQLNALALLWAIFRDWLRSLFGAKRA